jgi:hypothetical protein
VRVLSFAILVAFAVVIAVLATQNPHDIVIVLFGQSVTASARLVVGAVFLLGMLCGWAVFHLLRRAAADLLGNDSRRR